MKSHSIVAHIGCALVGVALCSSLALAQDGPACGDDIEKFCGHVAPGKLSLTACLNEHREGLSSDCRAKVDAAMAKIEAARKLCADDITRFCAEVKPGEGRILKCLGEKRPELAPACRQQVEKFLPARVAPGSGPTGTK